MTEALEAGYDLVGLAACYVAIGLLLLVSAIVAALLKFLDVGIGPYHPFHGITSKASNAITSALNSAVQGLEGAAAKFESGLVDSMALIIGIPLLLGVALYDLLKYLWGTALSAFVNTVVGPVRTTASNALTRVTSLEGTVADDFTKAKNYADNAAAGALSDADAFASHWIDHAVSVLNSNITAAVSSAERYTDTAVGLLRSAEDAAVAQAVGIAVDAKNAGINAAAGALSTAEGYTDVAKGAALAAAAGALTTAESYADAAKNVALAAAGGALVTAEQYAAAEANAAEAGAEAYAAQAAGAVSSALEAVRSIAVGAENDLATIEGQYGLLGVAALLASIPAIGTLLNSIATDTGLENEDCRKKVKGICASPTSAWGDLLAGLAATGFAFSLLELAEIAQPIVLELVPVISEAA